MVEPFLDHRPERAMPVSRGVVMTNILPLPMKVSCTCPRVRPAPGPESRSGQHNGGERRWRLIEVKSDGVRWGASAEGPDPSFKIKSAGVRRVRGDVPSRATCSCRLGTRGVWALRRAGILQGQLLIAIVGMAPLLCFVVAEICRNGDHRNRYFVILISLFIRIKLDPYWFYIFLPK